MKWNDLCLFHQQEVLDVKCNRLSNSSVIKCPRNYRSHYHWQLAEMTNMSTKPSNITHDKFPPNQTDIFKIKKENLSTFQSCFLMVDIFDTYDLLFKKGKANTRSIGVMSNPSCVGENRLASLKPLKIYRYYSRLTKKQLSDAR